MDNDAIPTLSIANVTVTEGDAGTMTATFTVTLSAASGKTVTVDYATADGTATRPADYTASSGTLTFTPGQTTKTVDVAVQGDVLDEANETYAVNAHEPHQRDDPDRHTAPARSPTTTPARRSSINDVSLTEGNAGTTNADFTVTLSAPSGRNRHRELRHRQRHRHPARRLHRRPRHAHVHPGPGDEDGGRPGRRRHARRDRRDVRREPHGAGRTPRSPTPRASGPSPTMTRCPRSRSTTCRSPRANSGTSNLTFTVTCRRRAARPSPWTTPRPTARPRPRPTTRSRPGRSRSPRALSPGPSPCPSWETPWTSSTRRSLANLSNPTNATIADNQGVGTITDNDAAPSLSISASDRAEGDAGSTTATFTVSLSAVSGKPIAVDYQTTDATATVPADYAGASGTISFPPGATIEHGGRAGAGRHSGRVRRDVHRRPAEPRERPDRRQPRHRDDHGRRRRARHQRQRHLRPRR